MKKCKNIIRKNCQLNKASTVQIIIIIIIVHSNQQYRLFISKLLAKNCSIEKKSGGVICVNLDKILR